MDLLPRPTEPAYPVDEIPFLAQQPYTYRYDYKGFSDYPSRCGWNKEKLLQNDIGGRDPSDIAAFLQSWLYFAAAAEVLVDLDGKHLLPDIEAKLVVKNSSGFDVIDNQLLCKAAEQYSDRVRLLPSALENGLIRIEGEAWVEFERQQRSARERFDAIQNEVQTTMMVLTYLKIKDSDMLVIPETIALSIAVLGDMFSSLRNGLFVWGIGYQNQTASAATSGSQPLRRWEELLGYGMNKRIGSDGKEKIYSWGNLSIISRRMLEQGWCPSDLNLLEQRSHTASMLYVSNLKRRRPGLGHKHCTAQQCHAYNVGQSYVHQHVVSCSRQSNCSLVRLPIQEMQNIIDEGHIPVATLSNDNSSRLNVQKHSQDGEASFVAISHVWSDGLGNPDDTELYICQLKHVQNLVNGIMKPPDGTDTPFWIDTLCIPLRPPAVRRQAIERMASVYAEASYVLVLDAELQQLSSDTDFPELFFRIALSAWNRRLWTLQEGVMAKNLWFQFKDRARSIDSLYQSIIESQIGSKRKDELFGLGPVLQDCMNLNLKHTTIAKSAGSQQLTALAQALQHRSCMIPSDESLCLATMLRLDLKPILDIPEDRADDRMALIWSNQSEIPQSIFNLEGPKLSEKRLPWAPRTMMGCGRTLHNSRLTCKQDNGCLTLECTAFVFKEAPPELKFPLYLVPNTFEKDGILLMVFPPSDRDGSVQDLRRPVLLVPEISNSRFMENGGRVFRGLLASLKSYDLTDGKINAEYHSDVLFILLELSSTTGHSTSFSRQPDHISIDIIIPPSERARSIYFQNAFGFTGTTNNGLVLEYLTDYIIFFIRQMALLLRTLTLSWMIYSSELELEEDSHVQLLRPFSLNELVAARKTMEEVASRICSVMYNEHTHTMSDAVECIVKHANTDAIQNMMAQFLNWNPWMNVSVTPTKASQLIDPDYDIFGHPDVRESILTDLSPCAHRMYATALVDDTSEAARAREHWPKLLMAFLLKDLSMVKDLFPRRQFWVLSYDNGSTAETEPQAAVTAHDGAAST